MKRTADRPLPARRMIPVNAFGIGWALSAFGIIHLALKVSPASAYLAAIALGVYVFLYTPLKRRSSDEYAFRRSSRSDPSDDWLGGSSSSGWRCWQLGGWTKLVFVCSLISVADASFCRHQLVGT